MRSVTQTGTNQAAKRLKRMKRRDDHEGPGLWWLM
jgi:hypothetical protein